MTTNPITQQADRLAAITPLLACPSCGGRLKSLSPTFLGCVSCERRYPVRAGVPILLPESMSEPGVGTVSADDPVSRHPYSPAALEIIANHRDGWVLDLGAGGKLQRWDNVIQIDIFRYPMTDVVATADRLPFRDNTFKAVISQAVFEHLQYPEWAAAEIRRVLQPGGVAKIDTAFLQPEHGYPHHFYNATETGLRHWFRDFDIRWSGVEAYQHPKWSLTWFLGVYLDRLGAAEASTLRGTTLEQLLGALDRSGRGLSEPGDAPILAALDSLPAHVIRTLAAGVSVNLVNPVKEHLSTSEICVDDGHRVHLQGVDDVRKLIAAREEIASLHDELKVMQEQHVIAMDRTRYLNRYYPGHSSVEHLVLPRWRPFGVLASMRKVLSHRTWFRLRHALMRMQPRPFVAPGLPGALPAPFVSVIVEPEDSLALISTFFSLVRQTYTGWELILIETLRQSEAIRQAIDDLSSLDERVHIVSGISDPARRLKQAEKCAQGEYCMNVPDGTTLAFDAIRHFVTLARDRPGVTFIGADLVQGDPESAPLMRCYNSVEAAVACRDEGLPPLFTLVRHPLRPSQGGELGGALRTQETDSVALIPKVLFRHVGKPFTLNN